MLLGVIRASNPRLIAFSLFSSFAALSLGCAPNSSGTANAVPVVTTCNIPEDQSATIQGRWASAPIPIALHQGDFTPDETAQIIQAADTWNKFFAISKNMSAIDYGGNASSPRMSSAANNFASLCTQQIIQGSQFNAPIVIYKLNQWPTATHPPSAIALTTFCTSAGSQPPLMTMAIIELNYFNFFTPGAGVADLQSIILHEVGHLAGLNHSCKGDSNTKGFPNCNDPSINTDYVSAAMFPVFGHDASGAPQQKRSLGANDESRVNCLYTAAK